MPELPEVETIKRGLESKIIGLKIQSMDILNAKSFQGDPNQLIGATVTRIWRRAKILGIDLEHKKSPQLKTNGQRLMTLLIHLKMSGQLIFIGNSKPDRFGGGHPTKDMLGEMPNKSARVVFTLISSSNLKPTTHHLYFNDQRKFGWVKILPTSEITKFGFFQKLGPEPLEQDFTANVLQSILSRHPRLPVKVAILDQNAIAGIGNIYASEACFLAGIHPQTPVSKLSDTDFIHLHQAIIDSLESSIKYGGSSHHTYVNESGERGYFLDVANVYDRQGKPCRKCGNIIQKITLSGRGTYFCSVCQPKVS